MLFENVQHILGYVHSMFLHEIKLADLFRTTKNV